MNGSNPADSRIRAYLHFLLAVIYYFVARSLAAHSAAGLASADLAPLVEQAILVFLLIFGYATMGFWLNRQNQPIRRDPQAPCGCSSP